MGLETLVLLTTVAVFTVLVWRHRWKLIKGWYRSCLYRAAGKLGFDQMGNEVRYDLVFNKPVRSIEDSDELTNVMKFETSTVTITLFEVQSSCVLEGRVTCMLFQSPQLDLPTFFLRPEWYLDKIGTVFGWQDIDFALRPQFSHRYLLQGEDELTVRYFFSNDTLDLLEEHKEHVFISPNIGFTVVAAYEGSAWFTEEQVQAMGFREELASAAQVVGELRKRGVRILGGGDYGFGLTPHGTNARDLDHFVNYLDYSPLEALLTMTRDGGQAMDRPDDLGQVRPGFLADLLLVDGNPLEDLTLLTNPDKLVMIMKDGKFHKQPAL